MSIATGQPSGELILRTLAMPADTNPYGDIFGGWIMAQMDIAGGVMAQEIAGSRVVTVAVASIQFIKPVQVGDVTCFYGKMLRIGNSSITINLEVWVRPAQPQSRKNNNYRHFKVTEAAFTYVAVDDQGKKHPVTRENGAELQPPE